MFSLLLHDIFFKDGSSKLEQPNCTYFFNSRVGADAWSLMYPSIPDKLQSLYNDGYKLVCFFSLLKFSNVFFNFLFLIYKMITIVTCHLDFAIDSIYSAMQMFYSFLFSFLCQVIFTNESNIERWKNKRQVAVDSKIGRLNNFIDCVKVPIQVVYSGVL